MNTQENSRYYDLNSQKLLSYFQEEHLEDLTDSGVF